MVDSEIRHHVGREIGTGTTHTAPDQAQRGSTSVLAVPQSRPTTREDSVDQRFDEVRTADPHNLHPKCALASRRTKTYWRAPLEYSSISL
jgi:hypothetical protein